VPDADTFFIKNPWPLYSDVSTGFCCAKNTGVYYFEKTTLNTQRTFEIWCSLCTSVAVNPIMQQRIIQKTQETAIQEETVWRYILQEYRHLLSIHEISVLENFLIWELQERAYNMAGLKILHCCGHPKSALPRNERARYALRLVEVRDAMKQVLGEDDLKLIFKKGLDCAASSVKNKTKLRPLLNKDVADAIAAKDAAK